MRNVWKGLIVGAVTGAAVGVLLDLPARARAGGAAAAELARERGPRAAETIASAAAAGADRVRQADLPRKVREAAQQADLPRKVREVREAAQQAELPRKVREAAQHAELPRKVREAAQHAELPRKIREAAQTVAASDTAQALRQADRKSTRLNSSHLGISYA